jgi:hypothetical protein
VAHNWKQHKPVCKALAAAAEAEAATAEAAAAEAAAAEAAAATAGSAAVAKRQLFRSREVLCLPPRA